MRPPRAPVVVGALAASILAASCAPPDADVAVRSSSAITTVPATGAAPVVTDPPPTSTQPAPPPATDAPPADPAADGIGDELFPSLGNPGLDVVDYDVRLRYDPALDSIEGAVTIDAVATGARPTFTLDAVGLDIAVVSVDGVDASFEVDAVELRVTPAEPLVAGRRVTVDVAYAGTPDAATPSATVTAGWFHTPAAGSYVLNEPDGARTWLPSNDHPSDKATWTFAITVPSGTTAVANGSLESMSSGPDGDTWTWRQADLMPTYLALLVTGDYEIIESSGPDGLPLVSAVLRDDLADSRIYLDGIADQIDFFDDLFGPYPLDRYGIAITDSFPGLAMETMGRSLFSNGDLDGSDGARQQLLLSHELAHQWFGDAVSPARWQDIWLNESFATYGQWLWFEHIGLATVEEQADRALRGRQSSPGATATPAADEMFGFNSYDGGAVVLHALRRTIGDDAFFLLLQRWVADNTGTSRTTDDFTSLAEEVAGADLDAFFAEWLYADVVPMSFP